MKELYDHFGYDLMDAKEVDKKTYNDFISIFELEEQNKVIESTTI